MTDKELSQYDLGSVLKSAHQDENQALRVTSANTSVPPKYSRVELTYNSEDSVTEACFYLGLHAEVRNIMLENDVGGSLNNTYFTLYSENDESLYHVWYNVSGGGTDPAPADSKGIEVQINTNDTAPVVALATQLFLEKICDFETIVMNPDCLRITNTRKGKATDTVDVGTGFMFDTVQQGEETLLKQVKIPFDGKTKYLFNTQEKKFEVIAATDLQVEITGEIDVKDPNTLEILNETITTKNVEEAIALPNDTKRYKISARNSAQLKLAFVATETATKYKTIWAGREWDSYEMDVPDSTTIYVLSNKDNTDLEITVWRRV